MKPAGNITVTKIVVSSNPNVPAPVMTFPVNITCYGGPVINLAAGGSQTLVGAAGTSCNFFEPPPSPAGSTCPAGNNASWTTTYSPSTSAIFTTPTASVVTITNTFSCEQGGALHVVKEIENNTQANINGLTFPATATCNNTPHSLTLSALTPSIVHNIPVGNVCSVAETLPPAPTNGCAAGSLPQWSAPVYTPASVVMTAGSGVTIKVKNVLNCAPTIQPKSVAPAILPIITTPPRDPQACAPPKVPGPVRGQCVCPQGTTPRGASCVTIERPKVCPPTYIKTRAGECVCPRGTEDAGGRCVRPRPVLTCNPPAFANRAGTACLCPAGTIARGNSCIVRERPRPQISCNAPARPNARGNACVCPAGMRSTGRGCAVIQRERPRQDPRGPRFTPRDVTPFFPGGGFGPRGGGGFPGGGGGGPRGGGAGRL